MRFPYKIYSNKNYWTFKYKVQRKIFWLKQQSFRIKNFLSEEKYKANSTVTHIKDTLWSIFKAVGFVALLFIIEHFATTYWQTHISSFPKWLINFQELLPKPTYPDDRDSVVELISVIASVTGIILALFYPILATIASTAYAKVHASIRNLLLYEKETQSYLRRLTYLTACSIASLLFVSFHFLPGNLVLSFLAFYAFTTLFGILKIGLGIYNFFEPSTLSGIVFNKLRDSIKSVTTEGQYWNERNFQNYNYKLAFEQTENLSLLTSLCLKDDDLKESSFKSIFKTSLYILQYYLQEKPKIPIDSLWFPNSYLHQSFFESDMTLRGLSQSTNTFIQPKIKQNQLWLEERIVSNLSRGLKSVVESGHINVLGESILLTHSLFDSLSAITDVRTGKILMNILYANIILISKKKEKEVDVSNYEDWKDELVCVETYCYALLRFQVGIFEVARKFNSDKTISEYNKIDWEKKDTIYSTDFIPDLYESLDRFRHFVEDEIAIEGEQITPDWYFRQSLISDYLRLISEKIQSSIVLFDSHLLSLANHFNTENNSLLSTFTSQFGLEILHKLNYRIGELKSTLVNLDKIEVCKGEFKWIKPNFEEIEKLLIGYEVKCFALISKNIEKLSTVIWNNQFPDIFAHSYSLLLIHLNECFAKNDFAEFQKCFSAFLKASINAFSNLNRMFKHFDKPQNISYQTLVDLMEISGYAYIYSVIYKKPDFWTCVKTVWDENFLPTKENFELFATYYEYYKSNLYSTGINFNEKHQRERTLSDVTTRLGIRQRDVEDLVVKPFIKNSHYSSFENVAELFIEIYLFTFVESKSATKLMRREFFKRWCSNIDNPNPKDYDDF